MSSMLFKLYFNLNVTMWQFLCIIQITVSIVITALLFTTPYFWTSFGLFAMSYVVVSCTVYFMFYTETRGEAEVDPITPCLLSCCLIKINTGSFNQFPEYAVDATGYSFLCVFVYFIAAIGYAWNLVFVPYYFWFITVWVGCIEKEEYNRSGIMMASSLFFFYILPQNIVHVVVLAQYETENLALYVLLSVNIIFAVLWYISTVFMLVQYTPRFTDDERLKMYAAKLVWNAFAMEILLLFVYCVMYAVVDDGIIGNHVVFDTLVIVCAVLCVPFSLPVLHIVYYLCGKLLNENWFAPFVDSWSGGDEEEQYDQIYTVRHLNSHHWDVEDGFAVLFGDNERVNQRLLLPQHAHTDSTCIRYQYEFAKLSVSEKRAFVHDLMYKSVWYRIKLLCRVKNNRCKEAVFTFFVALYVISRVFVMVIYPCVWYGYLYVYQLNGGRYCYRDKMQCAQDIVVAVFLCLYWVFVAVYLYTLWPFVRYEYWYGYFVDNSQNYNDNKRQRFLEVMKRNQCVFDAIRQQDIACVICEFLGVFDDDDDEDV